MRLFTRLAAFALYSPDSICAASSLRHHRGSKDSAALERRQLFDHLLTALSPVTDHVPIVNDGLPVLSDILVNSTITKACQTLESELRFKQSKVLYFGALGYLASVDHWMGTSSQFPACVFRPASPLDLQAAIRIIAEQRIPFAVSGGKHTGNVGFSSTPGIQIDMRQFNNVNLSPDRSYVDVGAGLVWEDVMQVLEGSGRTVLGGRTSGVGVGGYMTGGGGFSYWVNQFGLCIESIIQIDVVLPNGDVVTASEEQYSDLFFAIKGGGNQLGIFYNVRLATFAREVSNVWGGTRFFLGQTEAIKKAVYTFLSTNRDPRAALIPTFQWLKGIAIFGGVAFYDGPQPPASTFAMFDGLESLLGEWGPTTVRNIMLHQLSNLTQNLRGRFHTVSVQRYSPAILDIMTAEGERLGGELLRSQILFSLVPENAMSGYGARGGSIAEAGPWPFDNSPQPMSFLFQWLLSADDEYYEGQIKTLAEQVRQQALAEGQRLDELYLYPNYALKGTPAQELYGSNLDRLQRIKRKYDPRNTMRLATYFDF